MKLEQLNGIIRAVVPAVLAFAVGKGWIDQSAVADVTAAAVAILAAAWSVMSKKDKA